MICYCNHCHNYIEYDESDMRPGGDPFVGELEFYIICPECLHSITVGAAIIY